MLKQMKRHLTAKLKDALMIQLKLFKCNLIFNHFYNSIFKYLIRNRTEPRSDYSDSDCSESISSNSNSHSENLWEYFNPPLYADTFN